MVELMGRLLRQHRRIALDTSVFIYQFEANPRYTQSTQFIFAWLERSMHSAVTSTITMTELLVQPYRASDSDRVDAFYGLLTTYPNLEWIAPDLRIADMAAQLRAQYGIRTPDALQAATAISAGASLFISNDRAFRQVKELVTLLLDDLA